MTFSTTSFLAGVGTVFGAVALGFVGGALITTTPKVEPNRLERMTASAPAPAAATSPTPDASVKTATPDARTVVAAKAPEQPAEATKTEIKDEMPQSPLVPDRVTAQTPASAAAQAVPQQPAPAMAKPVAARDDAEPQAETQKKARDDQVKRETARNTERRAERRRERRRRDIEGAEDAVLQIQPDDAPQIVSPRYDRAPRLGFFGDD